MTTNWTSIISVYFDGESTLPGSIEAIQAKC